MNNISLLEESYKKFVNNLNLWLPEEGILKVNLELLFNLDLLNFHNQSSPNVEFARYFCVIETEDKITLVNDEFVIWIVANLVDGSPTTHVLIGLNDQIRGPKLELAFFTSGVYNTSKLVLQIIERFLKEIKENEEFIKKIV